MLIKMSISERLDNSIYIVKIQSSFRGICDMWDKIDNLNSKKETARISGGRKRNMGNFIG